MSALPPDLARLGAHLEAATAQELRRRRRRRALVQGLFSSILAAPIALAFWAAPVAEPGPIPIRPQSVELAFKPPTSGFLVRHIPDERVPFGTREPGASRSPFPRAAIA